MKVFLAVLTFVLFGCFSGYRGGYVPPAVAPVVVPTTPSVSAFPAAPSLPAVGGMFGSAVGVGYCVAPPEGVAYVNGHGFPGQCIGPNLFRLINTSSYYASVRMDGRDVLLFDQDVALPFLPPGQEAWVFIPFAEMAVGSSGERHDLEFVGYLPADLTGNVPLDELNRPHDRQTTYLSPSSRGGSEMEISQLCFAGYC